MSALYDGADLILDIHKNSKHSASQSVAFDVLNFIAQSRSLTCFIERNRWVAFSLHYYVPCRVIANFVISIKMYCD